MKRWIGIILSFLFIAGVLIYCTSIEGRPVSLTDEQVESLEAQYGREEEGENPESEFTEVKGVAAMRIYDVREKEDGLEAYVWILDKSYIKYEDQAYEVSGGSFPALLKLEKEGGHVKLVNVRLPEDGDFYEPSIREMFPWVYAQRALQEGNGIVGTLEKKLDKKIYDYWGVKVSDNTN